ncbi:MAG: isopentenyl-diphosphate Delta-isomerase [bacterium]|nr:isopentenyl-diphosphate Delta-isomerase [bacterium]
MNDTDYVVLVDEQDKVLGTAPKLATHNANTPLHRAFSVFLFNSKGQLLLQQRSHTKKTFPLIWSNSLCGHLMLNESSVQAARRRMPYEIGIDDVEIFEIIPDYRYKAEMNGIWENEICPILVCFTDKKPVINNNEVENIRWIKWQDFLKEIDNKNKTYSMWSKEEAKLLSKNENFLKLYRKYTK